MVDMKIKELDLSKVTGDYFEDFELAYPADENEYNLLEYVVKVSNKFFPDFDGIDFGLSQHPMIFLENYKYGRLKPVSQERYLDEQIQNTIRAYGLDKDRLWYLLLYVNDYIGGFVGGLSTGKGLLDELNEMNAALSEATEITLKKDGRKSFATNSKEVVGFLHKAMEYFIRGYNEAAGMEDYDEAKKRLGEMGMDNFIRNSAPIYLKKTATMDLSYRQYRFAELMLWFIKDIKPVTPPGVKVKVYRDRHLFVSMMMYVCGLYAEDEAEARDKWYEPYYRDKENRNLSNLVRSYKNRKLPDMVNSCYW